MRKRPEIEIGWPPPIHCYILFILIVSASAQYPYSWTKGGLKLTCKINSTNERAWQQVGTSCYFVDPTQLITFNSTQSLCKRTNNSYPARLDTYLIIRELKKANLWQSGQLWTGYYMPDLTLLNSPSKSGNFSAYNPSWAFNQPLWNEIEKCLALDISSENLEDIGWSLRNCTDRLPVLCETFSCRPDEWRCVDNSRCIPQSAVQDQIRDCDDGSDEETIDLVRVDSLDSWFGEEGNRSFRKYPQETWLRQNEGEISIEFDGKPGERRWRIENSQRLGVILVITGHLPEDSFLNISSCNSPLIPVDQSILPLVASFADPCITISLISSNIRSSDSLHIKYYKGCPSSISSPFATLFLTGPFSSSSPSPSPSQQFPYQSTYLSRNLLTFAFHIKPFDLKPITMLFDELILDDVSVLTISSPQNTKTITKSCLPLCASDFYFTSFPVKVFLSSASGRFVAKIRYSQDCSTIPFDSKMILRSSNQSLKLGTQMKGECPNGILSGNSIIECLFGGIWSNELGNCLEGAPFCPLPGVRNGYPVEYDGNRLLVQCRARFAGADGAASFTSNCDGRYWTPNPTCLPVNCSTPESLYNEATLKNSSNYWRAFDVAQYLIEDSISQNPFRQCSRAGTWNDFNFQKVLRCPGKVIPFGSLRSSNVGESILADCVQGFHPNQQVLCMNDGKYQNFPDLCIEAQYSPELCGDGEIMERAGYPGGYTCNCPLKQQFNGTTCIAIDECADGSSQCDLQNSICVTLSDSYFCNCTSNYIEGENHSCILPECSKFDLIEKIKDENTSQFVEPDKLYYKYFETVSVYTGAIYEHSETLLYYKTVWKCVKKTWELDNTDLWGNIYKEKDIPKCNGSQSDSWVSLNKAQYLPFEVGTGHCESLQETWDPTYCSPKGSWVGEFFCRRAPENRTEKRKMRSLNKRMKQKNECLLPGNKLIEATSRSLEIGKFATISCKYSGYTLLGSSEIGCSFLSKRNCLLDASSAITIYEGETLTLYCNYRQSCKNRVYWIDEEGKRIEKMNATKIAIFDDFARVLLVKYDTKISDSRIYICASEEGNEIVEKREIKVSVIPSFNDSPISSSEAEIFLSLAKLGTLVEFSDSNWRVLDDNRILRFPFGDKSTARFGPIDTESDWILLNLWINSTSIIEIRLQENGEENREENRENREENDREIYKIVNSGYYSIPISLSMKRFFLKFITDGQILIEDLYLEYLYCAETKIGLTHYPRTRIEKKAQLVQGSCSKDSIEFHQSFAECLPDGIWNRSRSVSSCKCREGKAEYLGECVERGTKCYSCSNDADCKTIKQCDRGEICYSKLAFYMDTKFVDQGCIKRENCILEESANCCDRDYCNDFRQTEKKPTLTGFGKCLDERRTSLECVEAIEVQKNGFPL